MNDIIDAISVEDETDPAASRLLKPISIYVQRRDKAETVPVTTVSNLSIIPKGDLDDIANSK